MLERPETTRAKEVVDLYRKAAKRKHFSNEVVDAVRELVDMVQRGKVSLINIGCEGHEYQKMIMDCVPLPAGL